MSTENGNFLFPELSSYFLLKEVRLVCACSSAYLLVPIFVDHLKSEKQMHICVNSVVCSIL